MRRVLAALLGLLLLAVGMTGCAPVGEVPVAVETPADGIAYYLTHREDSYIRSRLEDTILWSCQCHNTFDGEFGYGKKDVKVYNYWEKDYPIAVSGDTSSIVLSKNNEAQIIICNYGNAGDFTVELDTAKLNLKGKLSVRNGENNKVVDTKDNIIKFNLPKYDFIYLTVKGE